MRDIKVTFEDEEAAYTDDDRLIVEVKWVPGLNDTLMARLTNRVQDSQRVFIIKPQESGSKWVATKVRDETTSDGAWFPKVSILLSF